jgi:thiosulfate/3-mercaptopyruvate sulfurtransferase
VTTLVSPQWLAQHLFESQLIVLDASLEFQIPTETEKDSTHVIPGAIRFDYDHVFCDPDSPLPHMMPDEKRFNQLAREIGINQNSVIVVYDNSGTFASPRAWWMFKTLGHTQVYILDGGLTEWKAQGYALETTYRQPTSSGNFSGTLEQTFFVDADYVRQQIDDPMSQTIDARAYERFCGQVAEPREGLRSGHIPGSNCLPFTQVMNQHRLKSVEELKPIIQSVLANHVHEYIFTCGSGVTACIILLAAYLCGYQPLKVYDGSWTEWGQATQYPIAIGPEESSVRI